MDVLETPNQTRQVCPPCRTLGTVDKSSRRANSVTCSWSNAFLEKEKAIRSWSSVKLKKVSSSCSNVYLKKLQCFMCCVPEKSGTFMTCLWRNLCLGKHMTCLFAYVWLEKYAMCLWSKMEKYMIYLFGNVELEKKYGAWKWTNKWPEKKWHVHWSYGCLSWHTGLSKHENELLYLPFCFSSLAKKLSSLKYLNA